MALRLARGIEVNDETVAVNLIREVNFSGHYLNQRHTARYFRREHFLPRLVIRDGYEAWEKASRKTVLDRARERMEEILAAHRPRELDPAVERELRAYLEMVRGRTIEDYMVFEDESRQDFSAL
jgi:trimethylamine--corrinoid protein Co-methyltransferase